jgi:uncharacterized protein YggT (Ycf19 family)
MGILRLVFNIAGWLLRVGGWVVLLYAVLTWIIPQNKYVQLAGKHLERFLAPIRGWLQRKFPKLSEIRIDLAPIALFLLLIVANWALWLIRIILL